GRPSGGRRRARGGGANGQRLRDTAQLRFFRARRAPTPVAVVAGAAHAGQGAHPFDRERALRRRPRVEEREDAVAPRPPLGGGGALTCRKAALKKSISSACCPTLRSSSTKRGSRAESLPA